MIKFACKKFRPNCLDQNVDLVISRQRITCDLKPDLHHSATCTPSSVGTSLFTQVNSKSKPCARYDIRITSVLMICILGPQQTRFKKQETRNKKQNGLVHLQFLRNKKKTLLDSRIKFLAKHV